MEFSDFECPYCKRHAAQVSPKLKEKFGPASGVSFTLVNMPSPGHPHAEPSALAEICAMEQGADLYDLLFSSKPENRDQIAQTAVNGKVQDMPRFLTCIDGQLAKDKLGAQVKLAKSLEFMGTPTFAIGITQPDGKVLVKRIINGARPADVFEKEIAAVLKGA